MKNTLIAIVALVAMIFAPAAGLHAKADDADVKKSLEISKNMVKAVSGLTDDFKKYKGDFIQKDEAGNSYYSVNDLDLGTTSQYVITKPSGTTVVAAVYKGKDKDDKSVALAFAAFTGGILTITGSKDFSIENDKTAEKGTLKYFLKVNDTKIASFSYNVSDNEGTLLVAVQ